MSNLTDIVKNAKADNEKEFLTFYESMSQIIETPLEEIEITPVWTLVNGEKLKSADVKTKQFAFVNLSVGSKNLLVVYNTKLEEDNSQSIPIEITVNIAGYLACFGRLILNLKSKHSNLTQHENCQS